MDRTKSLKKLHAYIKNPELIKEPSLAELADLVTVVLGAVRQIEQAIKEGRLDGYTPQPDKDYISKSTGQQLINSAIREMLAKTDAVLSTTSSDLEARVQQAIQNIRDGQDGIVTDAEIERAASIAASLIELPDFDGMMTAAIQGNGALIRDALESLPEGEEQLAQGAVQGLVPKLKELSDRIDAIVVRSGGTIGKNQVYNFIAQAVADGTIPTGSSLPDQTGNNGKFLTTNGADASWATPPGAGGGITRTIASISTPTTAGSTAATDYVYLVTNTTLTLPTAVSNTNRYTVKCVSGTCVVDGHSTETIDGTATITFLAQSSVDLISDGTNFNVI